LKNTKIANYLVLQQIASAVQTIAKNTKSSKESAKQMILTNQGQLNFDQRFE
jgi:hypothetical protein